MNLECYYYDLVLDYEEVLNYNIFKSDNNYFLFHLNIFNHKTLKYYLGFYSYNFISDKFTNHLNLTIKDFSNILNTDVDIIYANDVLNEQIINFDYKQLNNNFLIKKIESICG